MRPTKVQHIWNLIESASATSHLPPIPSSDRFITDMGEHTELSDSFGGTWTMERYAVWGEKGRGKPEVIETSDDITELIDKYGIPEERILTMR